MKKSELGSGGGIDSDTVDGMKAIDFLGYTEIAVNADKLDGKDIADFIQKPELSNVVCTTNKGTTSLKNKISELELLISSLNKTIVAMDLGNSSGTFKQLTNIQ